MKKMTPFSKIILICSCAFILSACSGNASGEPIIASGVVEAQQIHIASEISGKISEILVQEGSEVAPGDPLLQLDSNLLSTQLEQAQAQLQAAVAGLEAANASYALALANQSAAAIGVQIADLQYQAVFAAAQISQHDTRTNSWQNQQSTAFERPAWYFSSDETIDAAIAEIEAAEMALAEEKQQLTDLLEYLGGEQAIYVENNLNLARSAYNVAAALLQNPVSEPNREALQETLQEIFDNAEGALADAQTSYDYFFNEKSQTSLASARGRVAAATERLALAQEQLNLLMTGENAYEVQMAAANLALAENAEDQADLAVIQAAAGISQAEEMKKLAESNLTLIEQQLERTVLRAPLQATVMSVLSSQAELAQAGQTLLVLSDLNDLQITVYISEDQYGKINLGDTVDIFTDSFPEMHFLGAVNRISDQAEYTPRNVQTQEERSNTVFAIEIQVLEGFGSLKPGMPVDVQFLGN